MAVRTSIAPLPHPSRGRAAPPPTVGAQRVTPPPATIRASDSIVELDAELLEGEPDPGMSFEEIDASLLFDDEAPAASLVAAPVIVAPHAMENAPTIDAAPVVVAPHAMETAPTLDAAPVVVAPIERAAPTVVAHAAAVVRPHVHPERAVRAASSTVASVSSGSLVAHTGRRWPWWRYTALSAGLSALVVTIAMVGRSDRAEAASSSAAVEPVALRYDPALVAQAAMVPIASTAVTPSEPPRVLARRVALRGQRNLAAGLPRLARAAFEEALQLDPRNRAALGGLGRLEFEAGRFTDAIDHLERALQLEPRDRELRSMLAQAHEAKGHGRSAARHARLATSP